MGIVEICIFAILFLYVAIKGERKEKIVAVVGIVTFFLLAALRSERVGIDVPRYVSLYNRYAMFDFSQIREAVALDGRKDHAYFYTGWFFSRIFTNPQWWLAAIALLYFIAVGKLIYKESNQTAISLLMLIALSFFSNSLSGLRQTIAMSILVLGYPFLKERRPIPFVITVIIAGLYHQTALVFLLIYPISNKRIGIYHIIIALAAFIIFYAFKGWLLNFLAEVLNDERYQGYTGGEASQLTMSGFVIQTVCFIFALYYYKDLTEKDKSSLALYNASFIGWVFQIFSSFIAEFFRISMYFSIFNIILVAKAASCEKDPRSRGIVQMVVIIIFLIYMLRKGEMNYEFFWQV